MADAPDVVLHMSGINRHQKDMMPSRRNELSHVPMQFKSTFPGSAELSVAGSCGRQRLVHPYFYGAVRVQAAGRDHGLHWMARDRQHCIAVPVAGRILAWPPLQLLDHLHPPAQL